MALTFDSASEFTQYDWENVSSTDWQDCFEEMVSLSRDGNSSNSSSLSTSTTIGDDVIEDVEPLNENHSNVSISPKFEKKMKLMQLVLLHEVWVRTGSDRDAFYNCLSILKTSNSLNPNLLSKDLFQTLKSINSLLDCDAKLSIIPGGIEENVEGGWYDIIAKTIERLPGDIPLMMTAESPLLNLLSILEKGNSKFLKNDKHYPRVSEKLSALLKQSRFLTDFTPISFIGKGGFGMVLKAKQKSEDLCYAVKVIRFRDFAVPSKKFQRVFREVTTLARLDHVNVVRYYSAWLELTEEYNDMLEGLEQPKKDGNETPSEEESYEDENSFSDDYNSDDNENSYYYDEYGVEDLLEDDMSSMSIILPADDYEDSDDINDPASHCMLSLGDDEEKMYIYASGSAEVGFRGSRRSSRRTSNSKMFKKPSLWRADSTLRIPTFHTKSSSSVVNNNNEIISPRSKGKLNRSLNRSRPLKRSKPKTKLKPVSVSTNSQSLINAEQFDYTLFIQMQLYEHETLKHWLANTSRNIDKKENLKIFRQIISGLEHVHQHGLLHRDLKPANIFLSKQGVIKIGDFGLSRNLESYSKDEDATLYKNVSKDCPFNLRTSGDQTFSVGTPGYVAPEILNNDVYGPKVDVYSLGIILMELYVKFFILEINLYLNINILILFIRFCKVTTKHEKGHNLMQLRDRIVPKSISSNYPDISELILRMTDPIVANRISLDQLARVVDELLDDQDCLKKKIQEQEEIIRKQAELIEFLQCENASLKLKLGRNCTSR